MSYNNPFADLFKNAFDYNQLLNTPRRNLEACSAASQVVVEGAQAISRRQAEVIRANVENMLRASKELMTTGAHETNLARQADFAKAIFENSMANLREISEMAAKSGFEAFDILNKRCTESIDELSSATSAPVTKKKAA